VSATKWGLNTRNANRTEPGAPGASRRLKRDVHRLAQRAPCGQRQIGFTPDPSAEGHPPRVTGIAITCLRPTETDASPRADLSVSRWPGISLPRASSGAKSAENQRQAGPAPNKTTPTATRSSLRRPNTPRPDSGLANRRPLAIGCPCAGVAELVDAPDLSRVAGLETGQ
jgi:hypothetical protein